MGGEERVARQHASGRLTVRERLDRLFDAGSFRETGSVAGRGTYGPDGDLVEFLPANMVVGTGRIDGQPAVAQGDDFTVRGGAADAAIWQKALWAEPPSVWEAPPVVLDDDRADRREEELAAIVPRDRRTPYDARRLLALVCDRDSVFELGARYGRPLITALARLDGRAVGVLCSDPKHYAGGLTGDASDKLARFVDLCDQFHLPVASFVDQPGFVIGTAAERAGTIRRGARALFALYQSSVPRAAVLIRKVYGVAGAGVATAPFRWAWPSGDWGSLPIEGGLEAAYRRELEAADDREALRADIQARLDAVRSPFRTAERFSVEEIVDPRDTRPLLCDWAARAHAVAAQQLGRKARGPRP